MKSIRAAVAATVEAAILAARNLPGYTFIPPGEEARVLGALLIDALPPDPELFETFDLWGIRSLEDLARLPENDLAARLGARGLLLQRLARGAFERPLRPLTSGSGLRRIRRSGASHQAARASAVPDRAISARSDRAAEIAVIGGSRFTPHS